MLEFYYKFNHDLFQKKATQLSDELSLVLKSEQIDLSETDELNIDEEYKKYLNKDTFAHLNNLYYTIRKNQGAAHPLLKKYLPELKTEPTGEYLFADFFSGAGGLSQGLINAGFQPAFVNDVYTAALETYYFNHDLSLNRFYNGDIKQLVEQFDQYRHLFRNITVIAGGPPCQGFSNANPRNFKLKENSEQKRFIDDERNVLYKYFVKLLGLIHPDFFIMENVRGMKRFEAQIEEDILAITADNYSFIPLDVDAQQFDIPQNRKRYILVGGRNFMQVGQINRNIEARKKKKSDYILADALFGLPIIGTNPYKLKLDYESDENGYNIRRVEVPQNEYLRSINNDSCPYVFNHRSRYNNDNDLEIFRLLPEGANSLHESIQHLNNYKNRDHIFTDKYYKLKRNEVCKTITSHMRFDCHMYIHPEQARGLSPREAARVQTFPDDYLFRGSLNDWYKQIGNAVPVKLAEIIATEIMKNYQ